MHLAPSRPDRPTLPGHPALGPALFSRAARAGAAAVASAALGAACVGPPAAGAAKDLRPASLGDPGLGALFVGCWELSWRPEEAGADSFPSLPDSIRLRDAPLFGSPERLVSPATHPEGRNVGGDPTEPLPWESRYRINRWSIEGDALALSFSDGREDRWIVTLRPSGMGLAGIGSRADSAPAAGARVSASRIECLFA